MQITSFGIVWIVILITATFLRKSVIPYCVIFSALFQAGAILIIADKPISPLLFSCVYYLLVSVFEFKHKSTIPKWFKVYLFFWILITLSSILSSFIFRGIVYMEAVDWEQYSTYDGHIAFVGLLGILIYGFTALKFYNSRAIEKNKLDTLMTIMVGVVFAIGIWQYLSLMHILPTDDAFASFIYSNSTSRENIYYFNMTNLLRFGVSSFRFHSCFMEPSHCAGFLVMSFVYFIMKEKTNKTDIAIIAIIIGMILLTFSSTAYAATAIGGILAMLLTGRGKQLGKVITRGILLIIIGIVVIQYFDMWDTIERLIINKSQLNSYYIRNLWNVNCLKTFIDTSMIGLGFNNVRGSSFAISLLGSYGLIGTFAYLYMIISVMDYRHLKKMCYSQKVMTACLTIVTIAQLIAISLFDYSIFYMCLMILMWTKGKRNQNGRDVKNYGKKSVYSIGNIQSKTVSY